ncbi:hypothetical protein RRF57_005183 [Xylaria bambusicola]|uniref:Uncharacterized protein n=1 Tax=Xylaria bambusicola TaxID=326684 RepID=A0AAN7Z7H8_9PEZI
MVKNRWVPADTTATERQEQEEKQQVVDISWDSEEDAEETETEDEDESEGETESETEDESEDESEDETMASNTENIDDGWDEISQDGSEFWNDDFGKDYYASGDELACDELPEAKDSADIWIGIDIDKKDGSAYHNQTPNVTKPDSAKTENLSPSASTSKATTQEDLVDSAMADEYPSRIGGRVDSKHNAVKPQVTTKLATIKGVDKLTKDLSGFHLESTASSLAGTAEPIKRSTNGTEARQQDGCRGGQRGPQALLKEITYIYDSKRLTEGLKREILEFCMLSAKDGQKTDIGLSKHSFIARRNVKTWEECIDSCKVKLGALQDPPVQMSRATRDDNPDDPCSVDFGKCMSL